MSQLRYLVCIAERTQHAEAIAASHIACYRERHSCFVGGSYIEQSATEVEVGRGTERDGGTGLSHSGAVRRVEMDAMRINRALTKQTVTVVHVQVTARPRKQAL